MKRTLAALALLAAGGCLPAELRTLTIPTSEEVVVPGSPIGGNPLVPDEVFPADAISQALAQSMEQSFATNEVDKDAVESLKLTLLTATVTEPEENGQRVRDLSFLQSAAFFVGGDGDDEPVKVAESAEGAFDDPAPIEYAFELTDAELAQVLKGAETLAMTADVVPGDRPQFATTVRFDVELTVVVDPVGALNGGP